jgi:hypothetical protein
MASSFGATRNWVEVQFIGCPNITGGNRTTARRLFNTAMLAETNSVS